MPKITEYAAIAEPYERKSSNVTFIISSFADTNAAKTPQELILQLLESRADESFSSTITYTQADVPATKAF